MITIHKVISGKASFIKHLFYSETGISIATPFYSSLNIQYQKNYSVFLF